jgi:hypothetical protein
MKVKNGDRERHGSTETELREALLTESFDETFLRTVGERVPPGRSVTPEEADERRCKSISR